MPGSIDEFTKRELLSALKSGTHYKEILDLYELHTPERLRYQIGVFLVQGSLSLDELTDDLRRDLGLTVEEE